MDFIHELGPVALGSRLRRISEQLTAEAGLIYAQYGLFFQPRWYPVFYLVAHQPGLTANEVAGRIGHTHAAVSQVVKELGKHGLLTATSSNTGDQRRRYLHLTARGQALLPQLQAQTADVRRSLESLLAATPGLWPALEVLEQQLRQQPLHQRVAAVRQQREASQDVRIREYTAADQPAFRQLNEEWIARYFVLEAADLKALEHPQEYILAQGGCIFLAEARGVAVGTCALIKLADGTGYELAKMAVAPAAQGLGIGYQLGQAAVQRARVLGARRLYLESNVVLTPAVSLYRKLGFQDVTPPSPSPYARANVFMELPLS